MRREGRRGSIQEEMKIKKVEIEGIQLPRLKRRETALS